MREYKFCGKRVDNGEWVYGSLITTYHKECFVWTYADPFAISCKVDPETVGQYTGLPDKNGTEIYEGNKARFEYIDPMSGKTKGYTWVVKYENGMWWLRHVDGKSQYDTPLHIKHAQIEIVGSIYDNPELLQCES